MVNQGKRGGHRDLPISKVTMVADCLPLYALPPIFPYRSYIGTLANGVWIGNPPGKLLGRIIDLGQESHPETCGFRVRPRPEVRNRAALTPEAADVKKSAWGAVALLMADLARLEHRHPLKCAPTTSPGTINLRRTGPLTAPPRPRKGCTQRVSAWVTLPCGQGSAGTIPSRPDAARYPGRIFAYKIFGESRCRGGCFLPGSPRDAKTV